MMPSAIDQRTMVLPKRKIKTDRGVDGFSAATRSSVSAIRGTSEMSAAKASAERADCRRIYPRIQNTIAPLACSTNLDAVSKTMPALVKRERAPGLNLEEVPVP